MPTHPLYASYVAVVTNTVRRVAVHLPRLRLSADLVLPAQCPVAHHAVHQRGQELGDRASVAEAVRWYLAPVAGLPLDPTKSLHDNGVRDGDLMLLTDEPAPPPRVTTGAPTDAVIAAIRPPAPRAGGWEAAIATTVLLALASTLCWVGCTSGDEPALWVSAAIALSAAVAAVAGWVTAPLSDALSVGAVGHTAVTGALAAAGFSWPVVVAVAAAAALAMAVCLAMALGRSGIAAVSATTGCAAAAGAIMLAAIIGALCSGDVATIGALLTGTSLAALTGAASLAVTLAGIGPARRAVGPRRAQAAHRLLTGLTAGWCGTAMVGVALVAAQGRYQVLTGIFAIAVGTALILRQRVHLDPVRRRVLIGAGLAALGIALFVAVSASPTTAPWWCCGVAVAGATLIHLQDRQWNPVMRSVIRGIEYIATAAVLPLAAWLAGVYDAVGLP